MNIDSEFIKKLLYAISEIMHDNRDYLIELDSAIGDGDLGLTMSDGFNAATKAISDSPERDIGKLLYSSGRAMASAVPSTMGTLVASGLMEAAREFKGNETVAEKRVVDLFDSFNRGISLRGKAQVGDKTFLDGMAPAVDSLKASFENGESAQTAFEKAITAAEVGYDNTCGMLARHGRAAARGEASRELKDPGAMVAVLIMKGLKKTLI